MASSSACGSHKHEMPKNLRTQLAIAVKSIQWSYGIFWNSSTTKQGGLEWKEGYYNGEIKTRKTTVVQSTAAAAAAEKIGFQRSEELRELYEFLHVGEAKRPSASLSPEDLTDLEWYYLVCMSFVFNPKQSLPGRSLENGETIWLCDAQYADSKIFSRSLLAKSASVQTVACFPYLGGVIEIGTTELIPEDPSLIQHVKACFLDFSKPICSDKSSSALNKTDEDKDPVALKNVHPQTFDLDSAKELEEHNTIEELNMDSPDERSNNDCDHYCQMEDSMIEGISISGVQDSWSSGDCIYEAFENQGKAVKSNVDEIQLRELQDCNHSKLNSLDIGDDQNLWYTRTLCALLGNSSALERIPYARNSNCKSSFVQWKKGGVLEMVRPQLCQIMLKKILFNVPLMHNCVGNALTDRSKETENFQVLKSMVPSINEVDKISILNNTIKYLKELEARVEELESNVDIANSDTITKKKCPEELERTSDNYDTRKICMRVKPWVNKRKASDIDESDTELNRSMIKEGKPWDVKVHKKEQEVVIEIKCPYREYILLDILDAINNMHLDAHTVQSSIVDGVFISTVKSKFRGEVIAPTRMIYEALWKVSGKF